MVTVKDTCITALKDAGARVERDTETGVHCVTFPDGDVRYYSSFELDLLFIKTLNAWEDSELDAAEDVAS